LESESATNVVYHESLSGLYGTCDLSVTADREYIIELGDFYMHIVTTVFLDRSDITNLVNALTELLQTKENKYDRGNISVEIQHLKEYSHLTLYVSKHNQWTVQILFYNEDNLNDFLEELEKMAAF
jgi:hypothetical protein